MSPLLKFKRYTFVFEERAESKKLREDKGKEKGEKK
jgi:hypothetical protein